MTGAEIMTVVGFFLAIFGSIFAVWRYLDSKMSSIRDKANERADAAAAVATFTQTQLQEYKTQVAETYVSKAGHRESTEQIMHALASVKESIDGTNLRIDRLYEATNGSTRRRAAT